MQLMQFYNNKMTILIQSKFDGLFFYFAMVNDTSLIFNFGWKHLIVKLVRLTKEELLYLFNVKGIKSIGNEKAGFSGNVRRCLIIIT